MAVNYGLHLIEKRLAQPQARVHELEREFDEPDETYPDEIRRAIHIVALEEANSILRARLTFLRRRCVFAMWAAGVGYAGLWLALYWR